MADVSCENSAGSSASEAFWKGVIEDVSPKIHAYMAKSGCNPEEAEELFWDVIADLFESEQAHAARANLWAAVLPILRECSARVTRWRRHEFSIVSDHFQSPDATESEERERNSMLRRAWLSKALRLLSPKQRQALRLHHLEGRPYPDVAIAMRSSEGAARKNVHLAIQRLRIIAGGSPPPGN